MSILAQSSQQTYRRAWHLFSEFTSLFGMSAEGLIRLPVSVADLSLFIAFLDEKGLAPSTIATYTSAIGYQHKLWGLQDPTSAFVIQKLLRTTRYDRESYDSRLPITVPLLIRLCGAASSTVINQYQRLLFQCMMCVAFWGFLRVGEITVPGGTVIQLADLSFAMQEGNVFSAAEVVLRWYKHNRCGTPFRVVLPTSSIASICPVRVLLSYLQQRACQAGPLFTLEDGSPVKRTWFANQLHCAVCFCGLDQARYKSHSFRIGAATWAAANGWTDAQIRHKGRWRSDAFKKYIRL